MLRIAYKFGIIYTKHHLKFEKNQADNLAYIGFRRRFFPVFYWCLVLYAVMIFPPHTARHFIIKQKPVFKGKFLIL